MQPHTHLGLGCCHISSVVRLVSPSAAMRHVAITLPHQPRVGLRADVRRSCENAGICNLPVCLLMHIYVIHRQ
jgi:hypothetical protein